MPHSFPGNLEYFLTPAAHSVFLKLLTFHQHRINGRPASVKNTGSQDLPQRGPKPDLVARAWKSELHTFPPRCFGTITEDCWGKLLIACYKYLILDKSIHRLLLHISHRAHPRCRTVVNSSAFEERAGISSLLSDLFPALLSFPLNVRELTTEKDISQPLRGPMVP